MSTYTRRGTTETRQRKYRLKTNRLSGRTRFRAIVRLVIEHRSWLMTIDASEDLTDNVRKNIDSIQSKVMKGELRITKLLNVLRKDHKYRTDEEKIALYNAIGNFKCFRRFPEDVRQKLVAHTYFEYYGANRVLFRQGHESTCMCAILKGDLEVTIQYVDPVFNTLKTERKPNRSAGNMVGEISLLHGTARTATLTTATPVQLLILYKEDFTNVIKASLQKQWDEIRKYLTMFPHFFSRWTENAYRDCCILSDVKKYKTQDIIFNGGITRKKSQAYFVVSGTCSLIQRILVEKVRNTVKLVENQNRKTIEMNMDYIIAQVCVYSQGACFGLGELAKSQMIIADTKVTILLIPSYILIQNNAANIWNRTKSCIESRLPSIQEVFNKCMEDRKWNKYKTNQSSQFQVKHLSSTTMHDVPYYWRVQKPISQK